MARVLWKGPLVPPWTIFDVLAAIEGLHLDVRDSRSLEAVICVACGVHVARIRHHNATSALIAAMCPICLANWEYAVS